MDWYAPKHRRDPNQMVHSIYHGVTPGGNVVTRTTVVNRDEDRLETTRSFEPGFPRGQGGNIGVFILGGMETTLSEMEYLLERRQYEKPFKPRRGPGEIADMCRELMERRNEAIKYYRKNPSEVPQVKPKPKKQLFLPSGYRFVPTSEPGLEIVAQV